TFLILFSIRPFAYSQIGSKEKKYTFSYGAHAYGGFILNQSKGIDHLVKTHPTGIEIFAQLNSYGNKPWEAYFNFPDIGLALNFLNTHNPTIGNAIALFPYINFYFWRTKRIQMYYHAAVGTAFATHPYHSHSNNKNTFLATTLNFLLQVRTGITWRVFNEIMLNASISLTHASNGSLKKPNRGLNVVSADIGIWYTPIKNKPNYKNFLKGPPLERKLRLNTVAAFGLSERGVVGGKKLPAYMIQIYVDYLLNKKRAFHLGIDFFSSLALKEEIQEYIRNDSTIAPGTKIDHKRIAAIIGHEVFFDKISLITQFGVYFYYPFKEFSEFFYERIALKYNWKKRYSISIALKAHGSIADAVEWGIGFRL
ncbi:acyloxyacyl hydrolase, partial [Xanthovirga aplysinae]|uniref:acyloxyacyl hydrolase n=1 Tax=Xanthovirga aplysinae TaxID=2529853 RepID=UPI0012BD4490